MKIFVVCCAVIVGLAMAASDGPWFPQINITGALLVGCSLLWSGR